MVLPGMYGSCILKWHHGIVMVLPDMSMTQETETNFSLWQYEVIRGKRRDKSINDTCFNSYSILFSFIMLLLYHVNHHGNDTILISYLISTKGTLYLQCTHFWLPWHPFIKLVSSMSIWCITNVDSKVRCYTRLFFRSWMYHNINLQSSLEIAIMPLRHQTWQKQLLWQLKPDGMNPHKY